MHQIRSARAVATWKNSRDIPQRLCLLLALTFYCCTSRAQSPFVETLRMSPGMTEFCGVDVHGRVWGQYEKVSDTGLSMTYFARTGAAPFDAPVPDTFTHVEWQSASDQLLIVGFATRPLGDPRGTQQAMVFDPETKIVELLPLLTSFRGSAACDISRDGQRISGWLVGRDPPRLLPCVWIRREKQWECQRLPVLQEYNPLLATARVALSPDGRRVAASLVTHVVAEDVFMYGLFEWQQHEDETWHRRQLHDRAIHLADINDAGTMAGRRLGEGRPQPIRYTPTQGIEPLQLPAGKVWGYTTGINSRGDIVGIAEDAQGNDGGSHAVLWIDGHITPIPPLDRNGDLANRLSTARAITDDRRVVGMVQITDDTNGEELEDHMEAFIVKLPE